MARKIKKTLGVAKSELDKFKIKTRGPKYLPRTKLSTEDQIFSSLVKNAFSQVKGSIAGSISGILTDGLDKSASSSLQSPATPARPLFSLSRSQAAAQALKTLQSGNKNL
jgi:hypothetical protein